MKVKIFDCEHEKDLENEINKFIEEIEKQRMEVKDIKYSTSMGKDSYSDAVYIYSALVMYEPRHEIYIEQTSEGIYMTDEVLAMYE